MADGEVNVMESRTMWCVASAQIDPLRSAISVAYSQEECSLLILDEAQQLLCYKFPTLLEVRDAFANCVCPNPVTDIKIGLLLVQEKYQCIFNTKRQFVNYFEVQE